MVPLLIVILMFVIVLLAVVVIVLWHAEQTLNIVRAAGEHCTRYRCPRCGEAAQFVLTQLKCSNVVECACGCTAQPTA